MCLLHGLEARIVLIQRLVTGNFHLKLHAEMEFLQVHPYGRADEAAKQFVIVLDRDGTADNETLYAPSLDLSLTAAFSAGRFRRNDLRWRDLINPSSRSLLPLRFEWRE